MSTTSERPVTKYDIENKLRELQGGLQEKVASQRQKIIGAVVAVSALSLLLAYLMGRRKGRTKATVVEIRRF
jgi:hypothetical protein